MSIRFNENNEKEFDVMGFDKNYYTERSTYARSWLKGKKPFQNRFWIRLLRKYEPDGRLLDAGCGLGFFLQFAEKYYDTYGVEISDYGIEHAKGITKNTEFKKGSLENIEFDNNFFNIVTGFDVLEHFNNPLIVIHEFNRILKGKGIIAISVPNIHSIGKTWKHGDWHGFRDKTHVSLLSNEQWFKMIKDNGFEILDCFYDGLWDSPYFTKIPTFIQHLLFKIPSTVLFSFNFKFSQKYGENLVIIGRKKI